MTSSTGKLIITINISSNVSKSKSNQTMKLTQLMEYKMRNIFLEKSCTKCGREASSRHYPEKL